ncbi:MAG: hypothetical protein ACP5HQ_03185 [Thermoprotei archaeon]
MKYYVLGKEDDRIIIPEPVMEYLVKCLNAVPPSEYYVVDENGVVKFVNERDKIQIYIPEEMKDIVISGIIASSIDAYIATSVCRVPETKFCELVAKMRAKLIKHATEINVNPDDINEVPGFPICFSVKIKPPSQEEAETAEVKPQPGG